MGEPATNAGAVLWNLDPGVRKPISRDVDPIMDRKEEVEVKLQIVRTWLEAGGLDGIVLTSQTNFAWLTGGGNNYVSLGDAAGEASLLVTPRRSYLLSNNIEASPGRKETDLQGCGPNHGQKGRG